MSPAATPNTPASAVLASAPCLPAAAGGLCRHVVRRLSRYRGELPPPTLAHPELRYGSGRVRGGSRSPPAGRRADLYPSRGARLAYLSRAHRRLLRHPAGLTGGGTQVAGIDDSGGLGPLRVRAYVVSSPSSIGRIRTWQWR